MLDLEEWLQFLLRLAAIDRARFRQADTMDQRLTHLPPSGYELLRVTSDTT
jgi:hypothetical protein